MGGAPGQAAAQRPDGISIVVPTLERVELVADLLRSCVVAGARIDRKWEVIIVDSSPEEPAARIRALCDQHGARFVTGPWRAGSKRNLGARLAAYDVVLFVDSDCAAQPDLFAEHLRVYDEQSPDVVAVAGLTEMEGEEGFLWRVLSRSREHNIPFSWPRYFATMHWATTSNFSVRRAKFAAIGGFDEETWTVTGCEDVDLGVRLWQAQGRIVSNDRAIVHHTRGEVTHPFQVMRKLSRHGQADVWLSSKFAHHTELRANPVVIGVLAILVGAALSLCTLSPTPVLLGLAVVPLMWIVTLCGRLHRWTGPHRHLEPLTVFIDWALDYGIAKAAIQRRCYRMAMRRFRYYDPQHFHLKPGIDRVPDCVFHAYGAALDSSRSSAAS
ncbi:glycosyltransferase family 2 protein [Streptomyces atratus]|uniref:Glycosyltransferase, GT2 family n=1 Tax=Streptomyces atratus TaxID=1893 RepID=A0A1K2FBD7_STRAR|nr:glycosyltransferase [Streptomyces atratus]SFY44524.1 Glycosyltransferase, GT2 family [Streptomyces atratus]